MQNTFIILFIKLFAGLRSKNYPRRAFFYRSCKMTNYTVRVELHATENGNNYEELHLAMRRKGFSRTINIGGVGYKLPTAEYSMVSDLSGNQVLSKAEAAASSVQSYPKPSILVTGSDTPRLHTGLERVIA